MEAVEAGSSTHSECRRQAQRWLLLLLLLLFPLHRALAHHPRVVLHTLTAVLQQHHAEVHCRRRMRHKPKE